MNITAAINVEWDTTTKFTVLFYATDFKIEKFVMDFIRNQMDDKHHQFHPQQIGMSFRILNFKHLGNQQFRLGRNPIAHHLMNLIKKITSLTSQNELLFSNTNY